MSDRVTEVQDAVQHLTGLVASLQVDAYNASIAVRVVKQALGLSVDLAVTVEAVHAAALAYAQSLGWAPPNKFGLWSPALQEALSRLEEVLGQCGAASGSELVDEACTKLVQAQEDAGALAIERAAHSNAAVVRVPMLDGHGAPAEGSPLRRLSDSAHALGRVSGFSHPRHKGQPGICGACADVQAIIEALASAQPVEPPAPPSRFEPVAVGRCVRYILTADDAARIMSDRLADGSLRGRLMVAGDEQPMLVVRVHRQVDGLLNGQVALDGNDVLWVQDVERGNVAGTWHWPEGR